MSSLEIRAARPGWSIRLTAAAALFFAVVALLADQSGPYWVLANISAMVCVVAAFRYPWRFRLTLNDEGLETADGRTTPYEEIQGVCAPVRRRRRFPINIVCNDRTIAVPTRTNMSSLEILDCLRAKQSIDSSDYYPESLEVFFREQTDVFGHEKVWCCEGRAQLGWVSAGGKDVALIGIWLMSMSAIAGIGVTIGGAPDDRQAVITGFGFVFCLGLTLIAIATSSHSRPQRKWGPKADQHGIIVAPAGLAIAQGELRGQLRWEEILGVFYPARRPRVVLWYGEHTVCDSIEIKVAGATFTILDIYDRPLSVVHRHIEHNRRGPTAAQVAAG